jgi:hypothetical protein
MNGPEPVLRSNAWLGDCAADGVLLEAEVRRRRLPVLREPLAPPPRADLADWRDPRVGWGLILPHQADRSHAELATAADAPAAIQQLVAHRNTARVFRYVHKSEMLRDYGAGKDLALHSSGDGLDVNRVPKYLLIYATPEQIPWAFQYRLGTSYFVGRLDLEGEALERYVEAAVGKWSTARSAQHHAVVWSVDLGPGDITRTMRTSIGESLGKLLASDAQARLRYLSGERAPTLGKELIEALADERPGLVVTTSHGQAWPLHQPEELRQTLGLPVDSSGQPLSIAELLAVWEPDGAIWYAHACCSAGCDSNSLYSGLFPADSSVGRVLAGTANLGALVAPLPRALLGAPRPLRAFVGHVEPTFDRSIKYARTGQFTTDQLVEGLYGLLRPDTVGMALQGWHERSGGLIAEFHLNSSRASGADRNRDLLLSIYDRQSTVILGDPAVALEPGWGHPPPQH